MLSSPYLVELFRHHLWANLRLIDACATLPDGVLDASSVGTYGSVWNTLVHILYNEHNYLALLRQQAPAAFPPVQGFADLRMRAETSGQGFVSFVEQVSPDLVLRGQFQGRPYTLSPAVPLIQAINHGTEHRAHIVTILSQQGVTVPALDAWAFNDSGASSPIG